MPQVSLLVPIYNAQAYLDECLRSAQRQTLRDIEVICINDGSTDDSLQIIQRYVQEDPRFRVIDKPNTGYGASMNQGLRAAKGTYVGILESDDFMEPDALERLVHAAEISVAQVAKADYWLYWTKPTKRWQKACSIPPNLVGKAINPHDYPEVFYAKASIWSAVYRRDFLERNQISFLETPGASYQDTSFAFKVWVAADRAAFIDVPVLSYRQDNQGSSVNSPGKAYCVCDEYDEMERYLRQRPYKRALLEGVKERMKYNAYLWNADRLSPQLRDEFLQRARLEFARDIQEQDLDLELFESWAYADLMQLLRDPKEFARMRQEYDPDSKASVLCHYVKLGGPRLIVEMGLEKAGRTLR